MSNGGSADVPAVVTAENGTIENAIGRLSSIIEQNHNTATELHEALGLSVAASEQGEITNQAEKPSQVTAVDTLINQLEDLHRNSRYLDERLQQALAEASRLRL